MNGGEGKTPCGESRPEIPASQDGSGPRRQARLLVFERPAGEGVAALADGRIVQGTVVGVKDDPGRPAAFTRRGFCGCWLLLDDGRRVVGNELRPITPSSKSA